MRAVSAIQVATQTTNFVAISSREKFGFLFLDHCFAFQVGWEIIDRLGPYRHVENNWDAIECFILFQDVLNFEQTSGTPLDIHYEPGAPRLDKMIQDTLAEGQHGFS